MGVPGWSTTDKFTSIPHALVAVRRNEDYIPEPPDAVFEVSGRRIFDYRNNTTAYSNNSALVIGDFLENYIGVLRTEIDVNSFIEAANVCDLDSSTGLTANSVDKRLYTTNGAVNLSQSRLQNLRDLLSAMRGILIWSQGKWKLFAGWKNVATREHRIDPKQVIGEIRS